MSRTYSTIHSNTYLENFSLYLSKYVKHQFMLEIVTSLSTSSCSFYPIIDSIFTASLQIISIGVVVCIGSIDQGLEFMSKRSYDWIQDYSLNFYQTLQGAPLQGAQVQIIPDRGLLCASYAQFACALITRPKSASFYEPHRKSSIHKVFLYEPL